MSHHHDLADDTTENSRLNNTEIVTFHTQNSAESERGNSRDSHDEHTNIANDDEYALSVRSRSPFTTIKPLSPRNIHANSLSQNSNKHSNNSEENDNRSEREREERERRNSIALEEIDEQLPLAREDDEVPHLRLKLLPLSKRLFLYFHSNARMLFSTALIAFLVWCLGYFHWNHTKGGKLTWRAWLAIYTVCAYVWMFLRQVADPSFIAMSTLTFLVVTSVINNAAALSGFSNTGVFSVACLFIMAAGIQRTNALEWVFTQHILKTPKMLRIALVRMMIPITFISAFMNNTPLVTIMLPVVESWSKRTGLRPSKLLLPLSYAAMFGGTCTLIGTSSNLVVVGLVGKSEPNLNIPTFEMTPVGIIIAVVCNLFVILIGPYLLPVRESAEMRFSKDPKQYSICVEVLPGSQTHGKTVEAAGLRHLKGVFLFEIMRPKTSIAIKSDSSSPNSDSHLNANNENSVSSPTVGSLSSSTIDGPSPVSENFSIVSSPSPDTILYAGDLLFFAGAVDTVRDLLSIPGLKVATNQADKLRESRGERKLIEVVVPPASPLCLSTVRDIKFRSRFHAAIIAVHRRGAHVRGKVGDIVLQGGDVLLLESGANFIREYQNSKYFSLCSTVNHVTLTAQNWLNISYSFLSILIFILLRAWDLVPLYALALAIGFGFGALGVLNVEQGLNAIKWPLMVAIAGSFSLSTALDTTGVSSKIADSLLSIFSPGGRIGVLFGTYLSIAVCGIVSGNTSSAVTLMWPIAYEIAKQSNINLYCMIYLLMYAGAASFTTPNGYQTNLMIYSVGGYRFSDYLRVGIPLQIVHALVTVPLCYWYWQ